MPKAQITTKKGTKILIEGSASEIKNLIDHIEEPDTNLNKTLDKKSVKQRNNAKNSTATDGILSLRESGYFKKPKNLLEIKQTLEEQGMIYPVTTISPLLLKLVRKRFLGRIKEKKKWYYVQR